MRTVVRRTLIASTFVALALAAIAAARAGAYLQHEDSLTHADAIFVLAGARLERALEAADLFQAGYAPAILMSPGREEAAEVAARARGMRFPREAEPVRDALASLDIPREAILIGDGSVDNTAEEGALLRRYALARRWRVVIVVTSKYHTRRTGLAMRRAVEGTGVTIVVHASRYDPADPAHWWRQRRDVRFLIEEWPKLIAYRLGLGG
jgi:uncharacterized SAM-binding protein YcdF (DUF218 family)